MSGQWAHRTNRGRVLYDRRPHPFSRRDVNRIARKFVQTTERPDELQDWLFQLIVLLVEQVAKRLGIGIQVLLGIVVAWASQQKEQGTFVVPPSGYGGPSA